MPKRISSDIMIDFDHHSSRHAVEAQANYDELRKKCPIFWSQRYGGFWGVTRYADAAALSRDKEAFSTQKLFDAAGGATGGIVIPPVDHLHLVPNETEGPDWRRYRLALGPLFTPKAVEERRARILGFTTEILDHHIEKGEFDFVLDFANPVPAIVTMDIVGLPLEKWHKFALPFHISAYAELGSDDAHYAERGFRWMAHEIREVIADVRRDGGHGEHMIGHLMRATIDDKSFTDHEILQIVIQILGGGVDTTTSLSANAIFQMHKQPHLRQQLIENPDLMPTATEEFMRFATPIQNIARTVVEDTKIGDQELLAGDRVMFFYASANRDADEFDAPEEIRLDRFPNRHMAWGLGTHRCLGSNLARFIFSSMIGEILARIPDYEVIEESAVRYPIMSTINSWISMPVRFSAGTKMGSATPLPMFPSTVRHDYTIV